MTPDQVAETLTVVGGRGAGRVGDEVVRVVPAVYESIGDSGCTAPTSAPVSPRGAGKVGRRSGGPKGLEGCSTVRVPPPSVPLVGGSGPNPVVRSPPTWRPPLAKESSGERRPATTLSHDPHAPHLPGPRGPVRPRPLLRQGETQRSLPIPPVGPPETPGWLLSTLEAAHVHSAPSSPTTVSRGGTGSVEWGRERRDTTAH